MADQLTPRSRRIPLLSEDILATTLDSSRATPGPRETGTRVEGPHPMGCHAGSCSRSPRNHHTGPTSSNTLLLAFRWEGIYSVLAKLCSMNSVPCKSKFLDSWSATSATHGDTVGKKPHARRP